MKITAVVTTYNIESIVNKCIGTLLQQTRPFDEIIVIDNASTVKTPQLIQQYYDEGYLKYPPILLKEHINKSDCRNMGWKLATSEIVAIIESDSAYEIHWCEKVMESFEIGAECLVDRRAVYNPKSFISKTTDNYLEVRLLKNQDTYIPFTAWVFKKEILKKLGGFDGSSGIEDLDLGKRLLSSGYKITYQPDAVCYHDGEPKTFRREISRSWWFGKEMHKYYVKHPEDRIKEFYPFLAFLFITPTIIFPMIFLYIALIVSITQSLKFYLMGMKGIYSISEAFLSILRKWVYLLALTLEDI
jgi:glycosyltransferase involved in cell wall biosynthesis